MKDFEKRLVGTRNRDAKDSQQRACRRRAALESHLQTRAILAALAANYQIEVLYERHGP